MLDKRNLNYSIFTDEEKHISTIKIAAIASFFSVITMLMVAALVFFTTVAPKDEIMMPKVVGMYITDAMLLLQENDLYAEIEMQFTENGDNRGFVLEQKPASHSWVRGKRKVSLVVSKGAVINLVPDFTGKTLKEVKQILLTSFGDNLLAIKEPIIYAFDEERPSGTVIGQRPDPETKLTRNTPLELVISRGPNTTTEYITKNFVGEVYYKALDSLAAQNVAFNFVALEQTDTTPRVIDQNPVAGTALREHQVVTLSISRPKPSVLQDNIFGIFSYKVPALQRAVQVEVLLVRPEQKPEVLFKTMQKNVTLSVPYLAPAQSEIIVKIDNNEVQRQTIQ